MKQQEPVFMWSPHPWGKLFSRFTFEREIQASCGDNDFSITTQLNNYVNYKKFRWIIADEPSFGDEQSKSGLTAETGYISIRTNSTDEIKQRDIVCIEHPQWGGAKYFIIAEAPHQKYIYTPNPKLQFQYLTLQLLTATE